MYRRFTPSPVTYGHRGTVSVYLDILLCTTPGVVDLSSSGQVWTPEPTGVGEIFPVDLK